jgi:hypothetical protein
MACNAVKDNALAAPIFDTFSVRPSDPVPFLHEMTLTAQLIAMVKIDLLPLFIHQKVSLLQIMAIDTRQAVFSQAMIDLYVTVGKLGALINLNSLTVMAFGALITFHAPFTGQDLKAAALVYLLGHYHFLADGRG